MNQVELLIEASYGVHLPIFPCFYRTPTEDRLERVIERLMDHADVALLHGRATQRQYDNWIIALHNWANSVKTEG